MDTNQTKRPSPVMEEGLFVVGVGGEKKSQPQPVSMSRDVLRDRESRYATPLPLFLSHRKIPVKQETLLRAIFPPSFLPNNATVCFV
jgi:hypothetical protein